MVFRKFLKQWFGYTRGERAGSFILLIILLAILVIRALNSGRSSSLKEGGTTAIISADSMNTGIAEGDSGAAAVVTRPGCRDSLYTFDPNTASEDKLLGLGLSKRQARTIINYRNTGARFYKPEDFRKIYGIDREIQDRLLPFIFIGESSRQDLSGRLAGENKMIVGDDDDHTTGSVPELDINHADPADDHTTGYVPELDINHADSADFEKLAGIGPVLAGRIVRYRNLLGYFSGPTQLSEVYGLSQEVIDMHFSRFKCDSLLLRKININRASYSELLRHPYISRVQVEAIISYRRLSGSVTGMQELIRNRIFKRAEAERLKPYIEFE